MKESQSDSGNGGGGTASAPVFLRLQQRAEAESRPAKAHPKLKSWRSASLGFLLFFLACCLALYLVRFVQGDVRFRLHNVELRGGKYVTAEEVSEVFYPDRDQSIYQVPLEKRRQDLEQLPWVRTATVTRLLPDRISVAVEERAPVAFLWTRRGILLIDADGVILDSPRDSTWAFPVLRGVSERDPVAKRMKQLEPYLKLRETLRDEKGEFPQEISEVDLSDPVDLAAVVTDSGGAVKLHMGDDLFPDRFALYRSHIAEWRQQFNEIQSIDLRYQGQAVIQSGEPATVRVDDGKASKSAVPAAPPSQAAAQKKSAQATTITSTRTAL